MKRITVIAALLVAFLLPAFAHAQTVRTIRPSWLPPDYLGTGSEYGGTNYDPAVAPPATSGSKSPRTLADDVDAGINFGATNNPITACSGLDIRDAIKGMFNMDSLVADVKNYLTSYLAKQALSMVYANPAIAGVLDGLKAFGNARFQLAQTSCEAIEGEISEQSRFLRQQAFEECKKKNGDDGAALYKCTTETGSYAAGLNEYVNDKATMANNQVNTWLSQVNVGGTDYKSAMCKQLSANSPAACQKADGPLAGMSQPVLDQAGNIAAINPPVLSAKDIYNNGYNNALGASLVYMGMLLTTLDIYGADEAALAADLDKIANKRKAAYATAMKAAGNRMLVSAVRDIFDRGKSETAFVGAARENTVRYAADIENRYSQYGATAREYKPGEISGVHGNGGQNPSYHYSGQAIDFNCNTGSADGNRSCEQDICRDARDQPGVVEANFEAAGQHGSTGDHCHVAFGSATEGPSTYAQMTGQVAIAAAIVDMLTPTAALDEIAKATTPDARFAALEKLYKPVPLVTEDACYYDLDLDKEDLEDISDITNIFAATTEANQKVAKQRNERNGPPTQQEQQQEGAFVDSINAQVQELKLTSGRLALCIVISFVDRRDILNLQYRRDGKAFMTSLAEEAAFGATDKILSAMMLLVDQGIMLAQNSDAPPKMGAALKITRDGLVTSQNANRNDMENRREWSKRKQMLDQNMNDSAARNANSRAAQGRNLGRNLGPQ